MPKRKKGKQGKSCADDAKSHMEKGKKMRENKKYDRALENFSRAIESDTNCAEAYFGRAITYQDLDDHQKALKDLNKAIQLDPDNAHIYIHRARSYAALKDYDKSLADLDKTTQLDPKNRPAVLFNRGCVYVDAEQYDKALKIFSQFTRLAPKVADGYWMRGKMNHRLGHYKKALADLDKAIRLNPNNEYYYNSRGITYSYLKKNEKALADLKRAIELRPDNMIFHLNKNVFHIRLGQYERALESIERAINRNPDFARSYFQRGLTYEHLRQYDKALEDYHRTLALDPNSSHTYVHIGIIYGQLHLFDIAFNFLNKAIKMDPKDAVAYLNRGIGYLDLGKHDIALKDFEVAFKLDPKMNLAHFERGKALCYLANGKKTFAEKRAHRKKIVDSFRKAMENTDDAELIKLSKWWIDFSKIYCDASVENRKRLKVFAELYQDAFEFGFFSEVLTEKNRLRRFMTATKTLDKSECCFEVLRRWNSFTPIIPGKARSSLGGGYFLVWDGYGSVIDSGYNYMENFINSGRNLGDIKNIIITHAHDDHTADFEALLSLFSKAKKLEKPTLFMNLGSQVKFSNLISKNEFKIDRVEILNDNRIYEISRNVKMKATKAMHKDILTETTSRGLIFVMKNGSRTCNLGITGDTRLYSKGIEEEKGLCDLFENMDVLVLHIGSMHENEFRLTKDNFEGHEYKGEHLGIRGVMNMVFQCRPKLAIISEFGEELKDMRIYIARWMDNIFDNYDSSNKVRVVPGDIGLRIVFDNSIKIKCEICGKLVELKDISYAETLVNDKISYHCASHKREEVVDKFREKEEKEIRFRARSVGCSLDLTTHEQRSLKH